MARGMHLVILALGFISGSAVAVGQARPVDAPVHDFVVLELTAGIKDGCGPLKLEFIRSMPDGTAMSEPFRVPAGRALVVTDVDWVYFDGAPNQVQVLRLIVENLADPARARRTFQSTVRLNAAGVGGASEHMTTGFVVSPGARICVEVAPGPLGPPMHLSKVLLRGYLAGQGE